MKKTTRFKISNMHCSNCSATIEKYFNSKNDIDVKIILSENEGIFTYDDAIWNEKQIENHLKKIGYNRKKENKFNYDLFSLIVCIILTIPFLVHMILMMVGHTMSYSFNYVQLALASLILLLGGKDFLLGSIRDIKNKRLGMDVLVALSTLTAYIYSIVILILQSDKPFYFETVAMLITIIKLGKYIENAAKKKTSTTLKSLLLFKKSKAKVLDGQQILIKESSELAINDIVLVSVGEKIPIDGIIIEGSIDVDESMLTGESIPVTKKINDNVYQGSIVVSSNAKIKVTNLDNETYLTKMIAKVEEIITSKPKIQKIADKIASFFVPSIVFITLVSFLILYLTKNDLSLSINRALAILMISCPCALGLATPLSILVGSSRALNNHIIYNNVEIFQKTYNIKSICFDKTGTLTTGKLSVVEYDNYGNDVDDIIYSMQSISNHPIAKALTEYFKEKQAKLLNIEAKEIIGKGIVYQDYFMDKVNNEVLLHKGKEILAKIVVSDKLKEEAISVVKTLQNNKMEVYLLTGDNKSLAINIAKSLNIKESNVFYEIKPEDKFNIISKLKETYDNVAFVGDGINDSLALNKADLSIAMGCGTDIAINSSDIVLTNNNLKNIIKAINISKKVHYNIIENFIWAFSYNLVAIPLAICGIINPIFAGIFMAFSSISVVLNSLRLKIVKVE